MSVKASGGSPVIQPQRYQTVPLAVISPAEQQDRYLKRSELQQLSTFFSSADKRLEIVQALTNNADAIISAGANRIFVGGFPMDYLEKPQEKIGLPGSGYYIGEDYLTAARKNGVLAIKDRLKLVQAPSLLAPVKGWWERAKTSLTDREPLPGGFRFINISRYGSVRMKRSMRDLGWFLRYITYAIVADDASILSVNARGLRGVIPEDVTEATVVALKEMRRQSVMYFPEDEAAKTIVKNYFDILITEYLAEKPAFQYRIGVSSEQQGLVLPESYAISAQRKTKFVMKSVLPESEKQAAIKAAYRQVFERDITATYGFPVTELESQVKSGQISMKEFVRKLGHSRLYRRLFYEPFNISRVVELAMRHFLGRGLSSLNEFQEYFDIITQGGLSRLVDALVDSSEYGDYFGEETVPYLRGLGQEPQECRNWAPQINLFSINTSTKKVPEFVTLFGKYQQPLPNHHPYGSGNDPLEIQFGAIFPKEKGKFQPEPAFFNKDTRRILISCNSLGKVPGANETLLKLEQKQHNGNHSNHRLPQSPNVNLVANHTSEAVIRGAYKQVFGRELLDSQRLTVEETKVKNGDITLREFIRQLAKSNCFRKLYWEPLYVTKAIEYIHRRLLGRPTYGRQEMNHYYNICATKGFYAFIDELIDSAEYIQVFGENTVPLERYVTPRGYEMRLSKENARSLSKELRVTNVSVSEPDAFVPSHHNSKSNNQHTCEFELNNSKPEAIRDTEVMMQSQPTTDITDNLQIPL
jgi:phycobilisome core-membrane linker protein